MDGFEVEIDGIKYYLRDSKGDDRHDHAIAINSMKYTELLLLADGLAGADYRAVLNYKRKNVGRPEGK
jgi:hypothetical protein